MNRKQGFTLIELLVVIAIIAILAAILFPVFAKARDKARQTTCVSNLKQIGLAVMQYSQDYDETFPRQASATVAAGNPLGSGFSIADNLNPYAKSMMVWKCPSSTGTGNSIYSYHYSACSNGAAVAQFQEPARTVQMRETGDRSSFSNIYLRPSSCAASNVTGSGGEYSDYKRATTHTEGLCFLFVDGHVKWFKGTAAGEGSVMVFSPDASF